MNQQPTMLTVEQDAAVRREQIRRDEILLVLEQWGAGYHRSTGCGYRYVAEIARATPAEWDWIKQYVADHPETLVEHHPLRRPQQWSDLRKQQGKDAFETADAAYQSGDWAQCLHWCDRARALGHLSDTDWTIMHTAVYGFLLAGNTPDPIIQPTVRRPDGFATPTHRPQSTMDDPTPAGRCEPRVPRASSADQRGVHAHCGIGAPV